MIPRTKIENGSRALLASLFPAKKGAVARLQEALGRRLDLCPPLLVSCASAGLYYALKALPRRKIYLPAYTCRALLEACVFAGRAEDVRVVDIDLDTYGMDLDALEKSLEPGSIVVATHQFGIPADMDRFRAAATRGGGIVIEDNAAAFGARFSGRETGTFGDVSLFSFDYAKTFSACGGGAVFFRDPVLQREVETIVKNDPAPPSSGAGRLARGLAYNLATTDAVYGGLAWPVWALRHGPYQDRGQLRPDRAAFYRRPFGEAQARLALRSLAGIEAVLERRKRIEQAYLETLKGHPALSAYRPLPRSETAMVLFPVRAVRGDKARLHEKYASAGVDLGFTFSYVIGSGKQVAPLEKAETAARQVLNLPLYSKLTDRQLDRIRRMVLETT